MKIKTCLVVCILICRHASIDYSEARIKAIKQGDLAAFVTFESEDQGGSVDMTLSSIVHNGLNDALMSTNNSLHWHSPSHTWSKTGMITIQSDFDAIDLAQWDASGLVEYSSGQYSFYANDYSADGAEVFLTHGNGKLDVKTATSW